ncbi:uncharacterized protein BDV14DRAFT_202038 [Aspergillus stella-maris]|uniref:uncharacterized protein n=1 Tax=Aspergillus stella-maris TaxID=1810926 RepID=UPI003CCDF6DB
MQPPPNDHPFHQYLRKITAQTQLRPPATAPTATETANPNPNSPPPRYTPAIVSHDFEDDYDKGYEDFDEYDDSYDFDNAPSYYPAQGTGTGTGTAANSNDPSTNPKTLTINLDSSITITGDRNTVAIPSGQSQSQAQAQSKTQPNAPKSKLANTASAIIAALQQSGVSASASLEINLDAGVRVEGSRNIVCFGGMIVPGRVPARAGAPGAGAGLKTMNAQSNARKRRAQSEPAADTTETKRSRN